MVIAVYKVVFTLSASLYINQKIRLYRGVNALFHHCTGPKFSVGLPSEKSFQINNKVSKNLQSHDYV